MGDNCDRQTDREYVKLEPVPIPYPVLLDGRLMGTSKLGSYFSLVCGPKYTI